MLKNSQRYTVSASGGVEEQSCIKPARMVMRYHTPTRVTIEINHPRLGWPFTMAEKELKDNTNDKGLPWKEAIVQTILL